MNAQEKTIQRFFESFSARDAEGMAGCYHVEVVFSDPVFGTLSGPEATGMWRMLCARAQDLAITFNAVSATDATGSAHWEATYTFSKTGRRVHNMIDASFSFLGDRIVRHVDRFDLWKWAGMALGPSGSFSAGHRLSGGRSGRKRARGCGISAAREIE